MQVEFPKALRDLETIEHFLNRRFMPSNEKLNLFLKQLKVIDSSLTHEIPSHCSAIWELEKRRRLAQSLSGRCHDLQVRREVIEFAEEAEKLANSSKTREPKEIAREADKLSEKLDKFVANHKASQNNTKFIRFARLLLDKARRQETVLSDKPKSKKNVITLEEPRHLTTTEEYTLAESLYELTGKLYAKKVDKFKVLFFAFPIETQREMLFHISECEGSIEQIGKRKNDLKIIQGLLGFAHTITDYYASVTPYPSFQEIHQIFEDLKEITSLDS